MVFSDASAVSAAIETAQQHQTLKLMSASERERSLEDMLKNWDGRSPIWIFAYGSLIWNPEIAFDAKRCGVVHGYHRSLCLWSKVWRGTPEQPGLVLALDQGGSCQGVAYRIPTAQVRSELETIWRRELVTGAYEPRWLRVRPCGPCKDHGHERINAIGFVIRRNDPGYAGGLDLAQRLEILRTAKGANGSSADYLRATVHGLVEHGIADARLAALLQQLETEPAS
jgi:cation transport protein ChaC